MDHTGNLVSLVEQDKATGFKKEKHTAKKAGCYG